MSRPTVAARAALEHLLGAVLVGLAASPWSAVTGPRPGWLHLGVAAAGATVVSLLVARWWRADVAVELLVSGAALALVLLLVVVGDPLGGGEVLRGLRDGLPRVLSTTLPLLDVPWAGVPGAVVVWATAGVVASTIARRRSVAGPVLAAVLCFLGGYAVTLGGRDGDVATVATTEALLLALTAGAFAVVRGYRRLPEEDRSVLLIRIAGAAVTVVIAVGAGAVATELGPFASDRPFRPRLEPAATELAPEGPLLVTRRLREREPDRHVTTVVVSGDWHGYVALAALDRYDGRAWSSTDDRLTPTGGRLPTTFAGSDGPVVTVDRLAVAATGGWLPYVGRAGVVEGVSVVHDDAERLRLAEPRAHVDYRLRSAQPVRALDDGRLAADQPTARTSGLVRSLEVVRRASDDRVPGERVCRLLALTGGAAPADADGTLGVAGAPCGRLGPDRVGFLRTLAGELASGRAVEVRTEDGASAGGPESLADLLELVGPSADEGRATGTPEQFAAAYALVADAYGYPVRLVTGFRVEAPRSGEPVELHGRDAWTWVEVAVADLGWVVVDPTPSAEDVTGPDELPQAQQLERPEAPPQEAPAELGVDPERVVVGPPAPPAASHGPSPLAVAGGVVLAGVLVPLLVAALRRARRRRARRRGDARARVVGAWHELVDVAAELGVGDVAARTTAGLVDELAWRAPAIAADLRGVATTVDRAVYSSRPVTDDEAATAWRVVGAARGALRRTLPRRTRFAGAWRVAPRWLTAGRRPRRARRSRRHAGPGLAGPVLPAAPSLEEPRPDDRVPS